MERTESHTGAAQELPRFRRCLALFQTFAGISAISLGGGLVMLPVIQRQFVEKRHWLTDDDMLDTIALTQSLPGIIAVNMSTLIGYRIAGVPGVLSATLGVILPPFATIVVIAALLFNFMDTAAVQHVFKGIRAAVCAMILAAVIRLAAKNLRHPFEVTVAAVGFAAILFFNAGIPMLLVAAAIAGIAAWRLPRRKARREDKP